jgi:hypothetical protein
MKTRQQYIQKDKDNKTVPSDGKSSHCLWQGELKMISLKTKMIRRGTGCN